MDRDQQMKALFKKIIATFSYGALWMLAMSWAGFYFGLALVEGEVKWYNIVFYVLFLISLFLLIRFFYRTWKEG